MMNAVLINNRYRILETLGRGGFGETYLVEDLHLPSSRKCVLKQLKPIVQNSPIPLWMKERFQREAAILEELGAASNQIPELYAYFSENQQFYLVQEWIEGETLAQKWQREGNLTGEQVKQILIEILPVLDFVHSRKIVHRDIKPENIILQGSNLLPVLIDFGALKEAVATTVHNSSNVSAAIGTPGYMPSEQAAGRPLYSSDLYSLGLTAIFLLTGKTPHELDIDPQTGEIIWQQYAQDVESTLIEIIDRAVRFHPRDRFSDASQMLSALQPHHSNVNGRVTGATVKVSPAVTAFNQRGLNTVSYDNSTPQQSRKKGSWLGRMFWFLLVTGGLTIGTFAAGFYAVANWWESRTAPSPQVKVEPTVPEPILSPPDEEIEAEEEAKESIKIGDLIKKRKEKSTEEEVTEETAPTPEVAIGSKPEPKPEPEPEPDIPLPILSTGTSESQLVSTLGQPTSQRDNPQKNSTVLTYRNATSDNVNLTYHSDRDGQIRQADVALNQELSLGTMQETLSQLLEGNVPTDAKNKLRNVYNRQNNLQSFRAGNLQGQIIRDSKDRVNISVWESGY